MATTEQVNLRRLTLAYLEVNPEKHDQSNWSENKATGNYANSVKEQTENFCGTSMCIAGTAAFLDARLKGKDRFGPTDGNWDSYGGRLLGLDTSEKIMFHFNGDLTNEVALERLRKLAQEEPNGNE